MNKTETQKLLTILSIAYNNFDATDPKKTEVWYGLIGDLDFALAKTAVQKLIIDSQYPPTIHDVRKKALEVQHPDIPTPAEAWHILTKNIRKYGSYRASEGIEALPPIVKETAQYMGYKEICRSEDGEGILRAQFMRMYEQVLNRRREQAMLPEPIKEQIRQIAGKLLPGSE